MKAIMENWRRYNQSENLVILMKTRDDLLREAEEADTTSIVAVGNDAMNYYEVEASAVESASQQLPSIFNDEVAQVKAAQYIFMHVTDVPVTQWADPNNPNKLRPEVEAQFQEFIQKVTGVVDTYSKSLENPEYSPMAANLAAVSRLSAALSGIPLVAGLYKLFFESTGPDLAYIPMKIAPTSFPLKIPFFKTVNVNVPIPTSMPEFDYTEPVFQGTEYLSVAAGFAIAWYITKVLSAVIKNGKKAQVRMEKDGKLLSSFFKEGIKLGNKMLKSTSSAIKMTYAKIKQVLAKAQELRARKSKSPQGLSPTPPVVKQPPSDENSLKEEIKQLKEVLSFIEYSNQSLAHIGGVL